MKRFIGLTLEDGTNVIRKIEDIDYVQEIEIGCRIWFNGNETGEDFFTRFDLVLNLLSSIYA